MSSSELKISITQIIEQINDNTVLEAYYEILKNLLKVQKSQIVGYNSDGDPITRDGLENSIDKARKRIESGEFLNHDTLKNDFKNW